MGISSGAMLRKKSWLVRPGRGAAADSCNPKNFIISIF